MKIVNLKTYVMHANWRNYIFLEAVTDDNGIVGYGEATLANNQYGVLGAILIVCQGCLAVPNDSIIICHSLKEDVISPVGVHNIGFQIYNLHCELTLILISFFESCRHTKIAIEAHMSTIPLCRELTGSGHDAFVSRLTKMKLIGELGRIKTDRIDLRSSLILREDL